MSDMLALTARADRQGIVSLSCEAWPSLLMEGLRPSLWVDGSELALIDVAVEGVDADTTAISYHFESHLRLAMTLSTAADTVIELRGTLSNDGDRACALNDVVLLGLDSDRGGRAAFAPDARRPVLLEQGNYWAMSEIPNG